MAPEPMLLVRLLIRYRPTDVGVFSKALGASVGAGVARATYRLLDQQDRASSSQLLRTNHRGESVTLAQGPATVLGATAGVALTPSLSRSARAAGVITALACGGLGLYDDLTGTGSAKGLRGHFAALREGEVTSGAIKVAGIGGTALVTGPLARGGRGGVVDGVLSALLIAASANALNLFDLRPGRAVKVFAGARRPDDARWW